MMKRRAERREPPGSVVRFTTRLLTQFGSPWSENRKLGNGAFMNLTELRREYTQFGLREEELLADPIEQFRRWLALAIEAEVPEPNAMTLATATPDGKPSARIVLLKGVESNGFTFFTNYCSRKGRELEANPFAALCIFWYALERQIRIEGRVEKVTAEESDAYHRTRPRGSQLGAWTSEQSEEIASRLVLEEKLRELEVRFPGEVPRPPHWGGYRLVPCLIEFWQGRENRLHDRICYRRTAEGWTMERLAP